MKSVRHLRRQRARTDLTRPCKPCEFGRVDDRALHLQQKARAAVSRAIASGALIRQPCEVCGTQPAQAHHDSYYPDKWLVVRWLCPKHHRAWHDENTPFWPTIYEFHPSDEASEPPRRGIYEGRRGRVPRPWLRKTTGNWYACVEGKQVRLGKDHDEAVLKLERLVAPGS